jgi:hypothetical protein
MKESNMSTTIHDTTTVTCQGFVYKWTHSPSGQYYIGIHKGTTNDGYIGSGKRFQRKWLSTDRNDWHRDILFEGDYNQCARIEEELVDDDTLRDLLCLNLTSGGRGYMPLRKFSRKTSSYRVKPQQVIVKGITYITRMQAIKSLHITFEELDKIKESESYNEYNRY